MESSGRVGRRAGRGPTGGGHAQAGETPDCRRRGAGSVCGRVAAAPCAGSRRAVSHRDHQGAGARLCRSRNLPLVARRRLADGQDDDHRRNSRRPIRGDARSAHSRRDRGRVCVRRPSMGRAGRTGGCDCAGHGLDAGRGHRQQLDEEPRHAVRLVLRLSRRRLDGDGDGVLRVPRLRRVRSRSRGRRRTHSGRHRRRRARLRPASETLHVTRIFPRAPSRPRAAARPQARLRRPDRHRQDDRAVGRVSVDR